MPPAGEGHAGLLLFEAEVPGAQLVHQLEDATATACHAGEGILGDDDRQAGFFHQQLVDVTQQRATTVSTMPRSATSAPQLGAASVPAPASPR